MQKAFSFDKKSIIKILKGAGIAGAGAGAIAILQAINSADISQVCTEQSAWFCSTWLAPFVSWIVPTAVNAIKEYVKGE